MKLIEGDKSVEKKNSQKMKAINSKIRSNDENMIITRERERKKNLMLSLHGNCSEWVNAEINK